MLQTAEQVAKRYNIGRDAHGRVRRRQPAEGLRRAGGGQVQRRDRAHHRDRPASPTPVMGLRTKEVTVSADEGMREGTTKEGIGRHQLGHAGRRGHGRQRQPVLATARALAW